MSEVRLNILDARRAINGTVHGGTASAIVASLSADPETIEELSAALVRYQYLEPGRSFFGYFTSGVNDGQ